MTEALIDGIRITLCTTPHDVDIGAAGDTQIDGTALDMDEFDGVMFVTHIIGCTGDTTAEYLQIVGIESASSAGTFVSYTTAFAARAVSTALAGTEMDDHVLAVDYRNPKDRWIKPRLTCTTGTFRGACFGIQYKNRKGIVVQTTGVDSFVKEGPYKFATPTTA